MRTQDSGEGDHDAFDPVDEHQVPGAASPEPEETHPPAPSVGQISEAGGASLNQETSQGGADAVPDAHG